MRSAAESPIPRRPKATRIVIALGLATAWLTATAAGFAALATHANTAGARGPIQANWPAAAPLVQEPGRTTLLVFAHPLCPCTAASLSELERVMAQCGDRLAVHVWFFTTDELDGAARAASNWLHAASIPGVHVHADPSGATANLFGAMTSGFTLVYSPAGRLQFAGGITGARGHEGDNMGAHEVVLCAMDADKSATNTPVFGCSLLDTECAEGER